MSQYNTGTVNVTNASAIITGVGTEWLANVTAGQDYIVVLGVVGEDIHRLIQTVDSDTQVTLAAPFGGATDTGRTYVIIRNFTTRGYALLNRQDLAIQEVYNQAITAINSDLDATSASLPVADTQTLVKDPVDATKLVRMDAGNIATATTRALIMPDSDVDFTGPASGVRRLMQEPIEGNAISGSVEFDGDPDSASCMLGELLQCDNSSTTFNLNFDPANINTPANWQGLLCWVRPTSTANLASLSVTGAFSFSWQNGYPSPNQGATTLYLGYQQAQADGYIIPVFKRSNKIIVGGPLRETAGQDLQLRFGTSDADAQGGVIRNYANKANTQSGTTYTVVQDDAEGGVLIFDGSSEATWTITNLTLPSNATLGCVIHNVGTAPLNLTASGTTFRAVNILALTLPEDSSCSLSWLPGNLVKLTGELVEGGS